MIKQYFFSVSKALYFKISITKLVNDETRFRWGWGKKKMCVSVKPIFLFENHIDIFFPPKLTHLNRFSFLSSMLSFLSPKRGTFKDKHPYKYRAEFDKIKFVGF